MVEVLIVMAIIFLLAAIAIPLYANAQRQARESALVSDARLMFTAMTRYYVDNGAYPSEVQMNLKTLSPLTDEQYIKHPEPILTKLSGNQLYFYLAPDGDSADQQFLVVTRHRDDPTIIVAVVSTDTVDDDGDWVEGVFVITEDDLADAGI
jgi:type II secretory pathway pseudopilin PulG